MKCEDAQKLLADYSVNGLDDETQRFLVAHLSACPTCRYELELLSRVVSGKGLRLVFAKTISKRGNEGRG